MTNPRSDGRQSWLDDASQTPLIDQYTQKLATFMEAVADGTVEKQERDEQEKRLVAAMKEVEGELTDAQHTKVTKLLCEISAYNIMQTLFMLQSARPTTAFRG
jgi:hypothetical protein